MVEGIGARPMMSDAEKARLDQVVDTYNKELNDGKPAPTNVLDKDDFLKILITQLQNQDPTEPMKDKEFIAQMAQFSSLEQMTNMSQNFSKLSGMINSSSAQNVLGKEVDLTHFGEMISGKVESVTSGDYPQVMVNGRYYDYSAISAVKASADVNTAVPVFTQEISQELTQDLTEESTVVPTVDTTVDTTEEVVQDLSSLTFPNPSNVLNSALNQAIETITTAGEE